MRVLNVIPHALRTPITTFRGLAEALPHASEEEIREEIGPALRRLAAQAEHLLDDMLIAAGYTTALPTADTVATPVVTAVREVWESVAPGRPLDVRGADDVAALAPEGSLHKVLVHVLDNAAKYADGPPEVDVRSENGRVTLEVCTKGAAVKDHHMYVEPFYRGESAVMRASGLGVGLTVARALLGQAGGTLDLDARPDGGLVTRLELAAG